MKAMKTKNQKKKLKQDLNLKQMEEMKKQKVEEIN